MRKILIFAVATITAGVQRQHLRKRSMCHRLALMDIIYGHLEKYSLEAGRSAIEVAAVSD